MTFRLTLWGLWALGAAQPLTGTYLITGNSSFAQSRFATLQEAFDSLHRRGAQGTVTIRLVGGSQWSPTAEPATIRLPGYDCNNCEVRVLLDTAFALTKSPSNTPTDRFLLRFSGSIQNFLLDGLHRCTLYAQTTSFGTGVIGFVSETGRDLILRNVRLQNLFLRGGSRSQTQVGVYVGSDAGLFGPASQLSADSEVDSLVLRGLRIWAVSGGITLVGRRAIAHRAFVEEDTIGTPVQNPNQLDELSWGGELGASGIRVGGFRQLVIRRCLVRNAIRNDANIVLLSGIRADSCEKALITQNLIHSLRYVGNEGHSNVGISVQVPTTYLTSEGEYIISNNMVSDIYGDGDDDPGLANSPLRGNYYPAGISVNALDPVSNARVKIYHNTIHLFGQNPSSHPTGGSACIRIMPRVSGGVTIEGNILQNTLRCGTNANKKAYGIALFHNGSTNFTIRHNAYRIASGAAGGDYAGLTYQTDRNWNNWQSLGYEASGVWLSTNVHFVDNIDLHLVDAPTQIVAAGPTPLRVEEDFDGENRPLGGNAPDLGADEVDETSTIFVVKTPLVRLSLYPNPSDGTLYLSLPGRAILRMYDLSGAVCWEAPVEANAQVSLPLSSGAYFLHLLGEGWQHSEKLLLLP